MITHGRQQILPPNMIIGRTQIQEACIGREVVFGSLWLSASALQAIVGAFGQTDGMAVINATNAYLNQLAASGQAGKDKATALAGFINEDPMMVCSLGLQPQGVTMPIRTLRNHNKAYVVTNYTPQGKDTISCTYLLPETIGTDNLYAQIFYASATNPRKNCYSYYRFFGQYNINRLIYGGNNTTIYDYDGQNEAIPQYVISEGGGLEVNGTVYQAPLQEVFTAGSLLKLFYGESANGTPILDTDLYGISNIKASRSGIDLLFMASFTTGRTWDAADVSNGIAQPAGTCGMINLVTGKFHPNANNTGYFDMMYRLPDGTPWTPSTP